MCKHQQSLFFNTFQYDDLEMNASNHKIIIRPKRALKFEEAMFFALCENAPFN